MYDHSHTTALLTSSSWPDTGPVLGVCRVVHTGCCAHLAPKQKPPLAKPSQFTASQPSPGVCDRSCAMICMIGATASACQAGRGERSVCVSIYLMVEGCTLMSSTLLLPPPVVKLPGSQFGPRPAKSSGMLHRDNPAPQPTCCCEPANKPTG